MPEDIRIIMPLLSCMFRKIDRFGDPNVVFVRMIQSRNRRNTNESSSRGLTIDTHSTQFIHSFIHSIKKKFNYILGTFQDPVYISMGSRRTNMIFS